MEPEGNEVHEQASEPPAEEAAGNTGDIVVELEGSPDVGPRQREAFDCPLCGTHITVPSRQFTTTIRCRQCRQFVEIPIPATAPPITLDVDIPVLPTGITDSGYTDMEGHAEYQCESCGGRLGAPFPRRCPECRAVLGDPLTPEEEAAEASPQFADTPAVPPAEPEPPAPQASPPIAPNWHERLSQILAWCLGRETETGGGYIEMPTRDPQGRIQFECASCRSVLPSRLPDECPTCGQTFSVGAPPVAGQSAPTPSAEANQPGDQHSAGADRPHPSRGEPPRTSRAALLWETLDVFLSEYGGMAGTVLLALVLVGGYWWYQAGGNPEVARTVSRVQAGLMVGLKLVVTIIVVAAATWVFRRHVRHRWARLPINTRRVALSGVVIACLATVAVLASGAPTRATRAAFAVLREADRAGAVAISADALAAACQTAEPSRRDILAGLVKVLGYQAAEDQVGAWVLCGRLVKYATALGMPKARTLDATEQLRAQYAGGNGGGDAKRAFAALDTLAKRYSSKALKRKAWETLAELLKCEPNRDKLIAALGTRYAEIVAWEEDQRQAQLRAQQAATTRRRQLAQRQAQRQQLYFYHGSVGTREEIQPLIERDRRMNQNWKSGMDDRAASYREQANRALERGETAEATRLMLQADQYERDARSRDPFAPTEPRPINP